VPNVTIYSAKIDSILVRGTAAWLKMAGGSRDRDVDSPNPSLTTKYRTKLARWEIDPTP